MESHEGFSAHDTGWQIKPARYAKGMLAVHCVPNGTGWKTRAMRLIGDGLNCRWSGREKAYIASPAKVKKFVELYNSEHDASAITGKLEGKPTVTKSD